MKKIKQKQSVLQVQGEGPWGSRKIDSLIKRKQHATNYSLPAKV